MVSPRGAGMYPGVAGAPPPPRAAAAPLGDASVAEYLAARRARAGEGEEEGDGRPPAPRRVHVIAHDAPAREALASLAGWGVLSAPLVRYARATDAPASSTNPEAGAAAAATAAGSGGDSGAAKAADGEEAWGSDVRQSHKRVRRTPEEVASAPYRFVGFLSTSDLVRTLVHEERLPAAALVAAGRRPVSPTLDRMARLGAVAEAFGSRPAISCLSPLGSDGDLLFAGDAPAVSLDMLVRQGMLRYPPRPDRPPSHRVAVFNAAGQVDAIISQSDVVRFLSERLDEVPEAQRTLADLSLGLKAPTAFASTKPAIDCLAEMELQARVAGAAVFDEASGTLVGTLSDSDLRGLHTAHLGSLALPVAQFLVHRHDLLRERPRSTLFSDDEGTLSKFGDQHAATLARRLPPVCVTRDSTLGECIALLTGRGLHRLWVVDGTASWRPIGCVTLTDVLRVVVSEE